jgi:hypothetical protein
MDCGAGASGKVSNTHIQGGGWLYHLRDVLLNDAGRRSVGPLALHNQCRDQADDERRRSDREHAR